MKSIRQRFLPILSVSILASVGVACSDQSLVTPIADVGANASATLAGLVVSRPFAAGAAQSLGQGIAASATTTALGDVEEVYVSLPPSSLPTAASLTIRNVTTGLAPTAPITIRDGGFDPVAVPASAGSELELRVIDVTGAVSIYRAFAPKRRPPGVVRTSPASGANDVALNFRITVVFTEPISPATLTSATVQLLRGEAPVKGVVSAVPGSPFAVELVPDEALIPDSPYRLVVTRGIRDVAGDSLEAEVTASFTTQRAVTPAQPALSVVANFATSCALRGDGKVLCWGANKYGQLGAGNDLVATGTCSAGRAGIYFLCRPVPGIVEGAYTFTSIGTGFERTCGLIAGGDAVCWGRGGSVPSEEVPIACDPARENCNCDPTLGICNGVPRQVTTTLRFTQVESGYMHSCGIRTGGGAYCWGVEMFPGMLGTGVAGLSASPLAVRGAETLTSLASGSHHVCGLTAKGAAYCWGLNIYAQLGAVTDDACSRDGNAYVWWCAKSAVPVQGGHTFVSLVAGWSHTCGLVADGRAYCWGDYVLTGSFGGTPEPVSGDLVFVSLSDGAAASHTCGVTAGHVGYCWGNNDFGQLGDGGTTSTLTPVRVAGGHEFSSLTTGGEHTCGVTTAGEVYCWGNNRMGQLGVGAVSAPSVRPLRVIGL